MTMNYEKANRYLGMVKEIESTLEQHQELFDPEKLIEFKQETKSLEHNIKIEKNDSRKLSIGIVGAVKAGKSSFLNACIFDGEDYLPKAATPMTAALTRITYSESPKAIIHFYTREDWETIETNSALYDEELRKEYDEYCKKNKIQNKRLRSLQEYDRGYRCKNEIYRGAKELTRMIKNPTILEKLDGTDEIVGDVIHELDNYVGANGYYTPIVSYVELQVDNPHIKEYEIVDTPGLNDPLVSRGLKTKEFLRSCDVVLLLSPCSQFMDSQTVTLMASSLPYAGVKEILVIGSKLDSGILNESDSDFALAYKKALNSYKSQFNKNLVQARNTSKHADVLDKMSAEKVLYVSSTCFAIDQKIKHNISLDDNEQKVYDNLHVAFGNYNDKYFASLGGINKVRTELNNVLSRKKDIIEGKKSNLLNNAQMKHLHILENILQETISSRTKLETASVEDLKQKLEIIRDVIDSSRKKLTYMFNLAITKCDGKVQQILPQLTAEMEQHQRVAIRTTSQDKTKTVGVGLFGWKKEIIQYNVTDNIADTVDVINNIRSYSSKCHKYVNEEFKHVFSKEEFAHEIKNVMLDAFNQSQRKYDEDDILLPLQNTLAKISVPHIKFDYAPYIDEIETRFKSGYAKNEEIHQLTDLQSKMLDKIEKDISTQLVNALNEIMETLKIQATCFADQIEKALVVELQKLQGQVKEREQYIEKYGRFAQNIRDMKAKISDCAHF